MIVERTIAKAKPGRVAEATALLRAQCETWGMPYRIYVPISGPENGLVSEVEFESLAKREEFWEKWLAKPDNLAWLEQVYALVENEASTEFFRLL